MIDATALDLFELNKKIKSVKSRKITVNNVLGQRFIGSGVDGKKSIEIYGTPGNALGAYLNNCDITVYGNAQDAIGDTMNSGTITVYGNSGDATGYAMRGGLIMIKGNIGYRGGIHMKEYKEHKPIIVVGGCAGNFLGEYQAGGIILVLGIGSENKTPIGHYCGTGMHGGVIYVRSRFKPKHFPPQVLVEECDESDAKVIEKYVSLYAERFGADTKSLINSEYYKLVPNAKNPYKQLYTNN